MQINLSDYVDCNKTVGVALSGGSDSMALVHYLQSNALKYNIKVVAINVEHGIRGKASIDDSAFVAKYCKDHSIPLFRYSVDCPSVAREQKLSIEQCARMLRYQCFLDAINKGACDVVATAHHAKDNLESVLFNLFRGTGLKGVSGIEERTDKLIRPLLSVTKAEIEKYVEENDIPFVTDKTNFDSDYTRNHIRLNVLPQIEKVFPDAQSSVARFSQIARVENDYMHEQALKAVTFSDGVAQIDLPCHPALLSRAVIIALNSLGLERDWEKKHVDSVIELAEKKNSASVNLPKDIVAIKEYDKIVLFKSKGKNILNLPFNEGKFSFCGKDYFIEQTILPKDLKDGLYLDADKIPRSAVIRTKRDGDTFTKFGGGTKNLNDYFTDKKIPLRTRESIPIIADGSNVLAIFGVAISKTVKVSSTSEKIIKIY